MEQRGQSPHRTGKGAGSRGSGDGRGSSNFGGASLGGGGGAVEADASEEVGQTTALTKPRLARGGGFLTLRSQRAGTTMARTSTVDHAYRAIPLRSAFM